MKPRRPVNLCQCGECRPCRKFAAQARYAEQQRLRSLRKPVPRGSLANLRLLAAALGGQR